MSDDDDDAEEEEEEVEEEDDDDDNDGEVTIGADGGTPYAASSESAKEAGAGCRAINFKKRSPFCDARGLPAAFLFDDGAGQIRRTAQPVSDDDDDEDADDEDREMTSGADGGTLFCAAVTPAFATHTWPFFGRPHFEHRYTRGVFFAVEEEEVAEVEEVVEVVEDEDENEEEEDENDDEDDNNDDDEAEMSLNRAIVRIDSTAVRLLRLAKMGVSDFTTFQYLSLFI